MTNFLPLLHNHRAVLLDEADYHRASAYAWSMSGLGQVFGKVDGKPISLHHFLLDLPPGASVIHLNGDRLDFRRCNRCIRTLTLPVHLRRRGTRRFPGR